jgi:hypothetical protein
MNIIKKFLNLSKYQKRLALSIFILLGYSRLKVLLIPFKYWSKRLGRENYTTFIENQIFDSYLNQLSMMITKISKLTPWKSNCLAQASCAAIFLQRKKIPYTLYLGVKKNTSDQLIAHAWIRSGRYIITGLHDYESYHVVKTFAYQNEGNHYV